MKGIALCADCAYYSMKKHRCIRGATDDSDPRASFFADCPLDDVSPVVHGIWHVDDYDSSDPGYYSAFIEVHCSECGYGLGAESGQYGWTYGDPFPLNYCPNCGAKMDLEAENR